MKFSTELAEINGCLIVHLPHDISATLPSRGMVMVTGSLNDQVFSTTLEPDGKGSHWFRLTDADLGSDWVKGETISLSIEVTDIWIEPQVPGDLHDALEASSLLDFWETLTPNAHWAWLRWIRATKNPNTRQKRIGDACSKMTSGMKRPCCFDHSRCTVMDVCKGGRLDVSK